MNYRADRRKLVFNLLNANPSLPVCVFSSTASLTRPVGSSEEARGQDRAFYSTTMQHTFEIGLGSPNKAKNAAQSLLGHNIHKKKRTINKKIYSNSYIKRDSY